MALRNADYRRKGGEGMIDILRGIFVATVANGFLLAVLIYQVAKMRKPEKPGETESAD